MTLIPMVVLLLAIVGGFLFGWKRGVWRSLWHCLFHVIRILLAFAFTAIFDSKALTWLFEELEARTAGTDTAVLFSDPALAGLIRVMVEMLAALIVFFVCMLLLGILLKPLEILLAKVIHLPKGKLRWVGGIVGMVSGFLIITALAAPFTGILDVTNDMLQTIAPTQKESTPQLQPPNGLTAASTDLPEVAQDVQDVVTLVSDLNDSFALSISRSLVGDLIFDSLTTVDYDGASITLSHESHDMAMLVRCAMLLTETEPENWTQEQIDAVHDLTDAFNDSDLLPRFSVAVFSAAYREWAQGNTFLGLSKPQVGDVLQPTLDLIFKTFATSTTDEFEHSLTTVADVMDILYRYEALSSLMNTEDAQSTALALLGTTNLRTELLALMQSDRNFCVCIPEVFRISIRVAQENMGIENADQVMNDLAQALNTANAAQTTEEKVEVLKNEILNLSTEHDLELTEEAMEFVSTALVAEFEAHPEVTKEHLDEWLDSYSEEILTNGIPPEVQAWMESSGITVPEGLKPENIIPGGVNPGDLPGDLPGDFNPGDYLPQ